VLPLRSNLPVISEFVFASLAPGFAEKAKAEADVAILGGENYGQVSSREPASLAPRYLGVHVVLAKSFTCLHWANLINFGVLPLLIRDEYYDKMTEGDYIQLRNLHMALTEREKVVVRVKGKHLGCECKLDLSRQERMILLAGGRLNFYRQILSENNHSPRV